LYIILFQGVPFQKAAYLDDPKYRYVVEGNPTAFFGPAAYKSFPTSILGLIFSCLQNQPEYRPDIYEAMGNEYITVESVLTQELVMEIQEI